MRSITLDVQISDEIREYVRNNHLQCGDRLPSERELADIFNVQRLTVRSALKRLIHENLIYSVRGSGNYIAEEKIQRNLLEFSSLTEVIETSGHKLKTKIVCIRVIDANRTLSKKLEIILGAETYEIKRIRFVNDIPLTLETSYIPVAYVNGIEKYDLENRSLYQVLAEEYGIQLANADQDVTMVFAGKEESRFLKTKEDGALLMIKGIAVDRYSKRIEYSESLTRGDRCVFTSELKKRGNFL